MFYEPFGPVYEPFGPVYEPFGPVYEPFGPQKNVHKQELTTGTTGEELW